MSSGINWNPNLPKKRAAVGLAKNGYVNAVVDYLQGLGPPQPIGDEPGPLAWTLSVDAIIWDSGPNGEADFRDDRYFVKPQGLLSPRDFNINSATNAATLTDILSHELEGITVACNLGERLANDPANYGTHFLQKYDRVRIVLEADANGVPRYVFNRPIDFIQAKITGASLSGGNWLHTWQEQREGTAGGVTGGGGGDQFHAATCSSGGRVRDNLIVVLRVGRFFADTSPTFEIIDVPDPQAVFPVDVTQVSGSGGSQTNYPSWTYDVKWNGVTIGSGLQPECGRARITQWTVTAGTKGSAYWGTAGAVVLFDVNEKGDNNACT